MNINDLLKENLQLRTQVAALTKKVDELTAEVETLSKIQPHEFTLKQFVTTYLTNRFKLEKMPKRSGIYAYYNPVKQLLYVGQSVNMANRLKQHFRNGKIKISGHDSEFNDEKDWQFYVLEYIPKSKKQLLDEREAFWIAMAKVASSRKTIVDTNQISLYEQALKSGQSTRDYQISTKTAKEGTVTNRTRGNKVQM